MARPGAGALAARSRELPTKRAFMTSLETVFAAVVANIRATIAEDWVFDFPFTADTRFNRDLEIESIEFVKIADAIQSHFGRDLDILGWLADKTVDELIDLSLGELAEHIHSAANS